MQREKQENFENLHVNHRQRMYEKVLSGGLDLFYEHEILEMLLYVPIRRQNTNPTAHKLIKRYGSLGNVLHTSSSELRKIDGIGETTAEYISNINRLFFDISESCRERSKKLANLTSTELLSNATDIVLKKAQESGNGFMTIALLREDGLFDEILTLSLKEVDYRRILQFSIEGKSNVFVTCEKSESLLHSESTEIINSLKVVGIEVIAAYFVSDDFGIELKSGEIFDPQ